MVGWLRPVLTAPVVMVALWGCWWAPRRPARIRPEREVAGMRPAGPDAERTWFRRPLGVAGMAYKAVLSPRERRTGRPRDGTVTWSRGGR